MASPKLSASFYRNTDVTDASKKLLGKVLCTKMDDHPVTSGMIVETEAYRGRNDEACHANNGLRTNRTEVMYRSGGLAYVYLCYGIHHLFNVVTNVKDMADAVLVRAVEPIDGKPTISARREMDVSSPAVTAGPGRLTQALGITTDATGIDLTGSVIWIEDRDVHITNDDIAATPRIGVDYAGEHAQRPWRFTLKNSRWISK